MPVGLASLVMQMQAFFTILFAWAFLRRAADADAGDRRRASPSPAWRVIGSARLGRRRLRPFALTLAGGVCWGAGNRRRQDRRQGRSARLHRLVEPRRAAADAARCRLRFERGRRSPALLHPTLHADRLASR